MSYEPPAYDATSPATSDDPYSPPVYDAVDFGSAAGATIAAPVTQITFGTPQSAISGVGTIVLNSPRTRITLDAPTAMAAGTGTAALDTAATPLTLGTPRPSAFTPRLRGSPPATGWFVEIDHPETGRTIAPAVLDEPEIVPSINGQPEVQIPVRREDAWLSPTYDQAAQRPTMRVWRDGERQPIDELRNVSHETGRTILTGVGGVALEQRVQATFDIERRHSAAAQLIGNNTSYGVDVDTPDTDILTDQLQYSLSTTAGFADRLDAGPSDPVVAEGGTTRVAQTSFTLTANEIVNQGAFSGNQVFDSSYADGVAIELSSSGDFLEFDFELEYDIPLIFESDTSTLSSFEGALHGAASADGGGAIDVIIDGDQFERV